MENARVILTPLDPRYPSRLRELVRPPASITAKGGSLEADFTVAIVGSRLATSEALAFAGELAAALAATETVVVSGGARGIDAAAHHAVLGAGGRTWVIAGTDPDRCYPKEHDQLFATVAEGPGAVVWPFAPSRASRMAFPSRNRLLVALADAVVVVQAGRRSGALSAARWARALSKPLWVVAAAPWMGDKYDGSRQLLDEGARPLTSCRGFMTAVGLAPPLPLPPGSTSLSPQENMVLGALCDVPRHLDSVTAQTHLPTHLTSAALLTLALENVVVEGPPGFFRRRDTS